MKTTLKFKIAGLLSALCLNSFSQGGYGEIRGIIKNTELETVPFATVKILQGNQLIGGTTADENGHYKYKPLNPGLYEMIIYEAGHQTQPINKIKVIPNEATYVDVKLNINTLTTVTVMAKAYDYSQSGVDKNMYSMVSIDAKELNLNAGYERGNIQGALSSISSDAYTDTKGEVHVRGSRGDASGYFVDGVRTLGANTIPGLAIENLTFFSGGMPAMYGDMSSGAVIITTKSYFSGIREKNMRNAEERNREIAQKARERESAEEDARKKEIEAEKLKEKTK